MFHEMTKPSMFRRLKWHLLSQKVDVGFRSCYEKGKGHDPYGRITLDSDVHEFTGPIWSISRLNMHSSKMCGKIIAKKRPLLVIGKRATILKSHCTVSGLCKNTILKWCILVVSRKHNMLGVNQKIIAFSCSKMLRMIHPKTGTCYLCSKPRMCFHSVRIQICILHSLHL